MTVLHELDEAREELRVLEKCEKHGINLIGAGIFVIFLSVIGAVLFGGEALAGLLAALALGFFGCVQLFQSRRVIEVGVGYSGQTKYINIEYKRRRVRRLEREYETEIGVG